MSYVIGIDSSTTATKAIVVDRAGGVVGGGVVRVRTTRRRGRSGPSRIPALWWDATVDRRPPGPRRSAASPAPRSRRSVSPARCTARSSSTRQAKWCGRRSCGTTSAPRPSATRSGAGSGADRLIEVTGNDALTGFTAPKLLWVPRHEPDNWARVATHPPPQGLRPVPPDRRACRRRRRRVGHDPLRPRGPHLVARDPRRRSTSTRALLPADVRGPEVTGLVDAAAAAATGLRGGNPGRRRRRRPVGQRRRRRRGGPGVVALSLGTSGVVFATTDGPADRGRRAGSTPSATPSRAGGT